MGTLARNRLITIYARILSPFVKACAIANNDKDLILTKACLTYYKA